MILRGKRDPAIRTEGDVSQAIFILQAQDRAHKRRPSVPPSSEVVKGNLPLAEGGGRPRDSPATYICNLGTNCRSNRFNTLHPPDAPREAKNANRCHRSCALWGEANLPPPRQPPHGFDLRLVGANGVTLINRLRLVAGQGHGHGAGHAPLLALHHEGAPKIMEPRARNPCLLTGGAPRSIKVLHRLPPRVVKDEVGGFPEQVVSRRSPLSQQGVEFRVAREGELTPFPALRLPDVQPNHTVLKTHLRPSKPENFRLPPTRKGREPDHGAEIVGQIRDDCLMVEG